MTTAAQLLSQLGSAGVRLWLDEEGQLRFKAPKGALTPELKERLLGIKEEMVAFLHEANRHQFTDPIPAQPRTGHDSFPLSFAQERFWFLDRLLPGNPSLHIPAVLQINGRLDIDRLRTAFTRLAARHEVLRTALQFDDAHEARQVIGPPTLWELAENFDLSHLPAEQQQQHIRQIAEEEALRPFNLGSSPLARTRLARLTAADSAEPQHILFLTLHHIIADGWSIGLLVQELASLYEDAGQQDRAMLPELPIQYADFSVWQRQWMESDQMRDELAWWQGAMREVPVLELPTDLPRPRQLGSAGASLSFACPASITQCIGKTAQEAQASLFALLLGAFQLLLHRYSGQRDFCTGIPVAGRNRREMEQLIGCCINLLPIRATMDPAETLRSFLGRVQQAILAAMEHQEVPFERIAEACVENRSLSHSPLFQVLFTHQQGALLQSLPVNGLSISLQPQPSVSAKYELQLHIEENADGLTGIIEYNMALFMPETIRDLARHYGNLLSALAQEQNLQLPVAALSLFDEQDRALLVPAKPAKMNTGTLAQLLSQHRDSTAVAVRCGERSITHRALHQRAAALAKLLQEQGVGPNQRVGICLYPGIEFMTALLAILRCGACYVPMDPAYPQERLQHMAAHAAMMLVVTEGCLSSLLQQNTQTLLLDQLDLAGSDTRWESREEADGLLYLIYTSGSTGLPKGAGVTYANEVNLLHWYQEKYRITTNERVLVISSPGFDLTQKNLLAPLAAGGEILFSPATRYDPECILDTIAQHQASWINCAPSAFYPLVEMAHRQHRLQQLQSVRHLLFGGEPIALENLQPWFDSGHCTVRITNMYGPTECTDITTAYTLEEPWKNIGKPIPIGEVIDGVVAYLLDDAGQPVPVGTPGELYIGGASVGPGYFHTDEKSRNELNRAAFLPNPFGDGVIYRTRDLVRARRGKSGLLLEFLARCDDQVKIRGFRVEPGEISSRLMQLDSVRDALVISRKNPEGQQRLVAYYLPASGTEVDLHTLRSHLKKHLPDYMIPGAFVALPEWPLSPNGKIDRKALPQPGPEHTVQAHYVAPHTLTEEQLAQLWQQLLGLDAVGIHDNFFELGGHSLVATRLAGLVATTFGRELPLSLFFEKPTIAEQAAHLDLGGHLEQDRLATKIPPANRTLPIPLSPAQERIWIIEQFNPGSAAYNIPFAMALTGKLNRVAFCRAVADLVARHEPLRTAIITAADGTPGQQVESPDSFTLVEIDLSSHSDPHQEAIARFARESAQPFAVAAGERLFRAELLHLGENKSVFMATLHHLVGDGWSLTVLQRELVACYEARCREQSPALAPLAVQYADFSVWQRSELAGEAVQHHLEYWVAQLHDAPANINLPTDRPRPAQQSFHGAMASGKLGSALSARVAAFAKELGTTHFTVLLTAFSLLLQKHSHQHDFCIGVPVSGRERPELQGLVGCFVNAVIIRSRLGGNPTIHELLERIQESAIAAFSHQEVPVERVLERLPLIRNPSYPPVAQVGFSHISAELAAVAEVAGLAITALDTPKVVAKYDLTLIAAEQPGDLEIHLEYNTDLFDATSAERICRHFIRLLDCCISTPELPVNSIDLLDDSERYAATHSCEELVEEILPLSPMQHDLVLAQLLHPESLANTLGYRADLGFTVDAVLWQQAVNLMAARQKITRTLFRQSRLAYGEEAYQCILRNLTIPLEVMDYREENLSEAEISRRADAFIYQPGEYRNERFIRYGLIWLAGNRTVLLLSSHHALLDGVAIVLIAETTARYYEALHQQQDLATLPQLPDLFSGYVMKSRREIDTRATQAFWQEKLAACEAVDFPLPAPTGMAKQVVKSTQLPGSLWQPLKGWCRRQATTPAQLLKVLYSLAIATYCRSNSDFALSEFQAGRDGTTATSLGCYFRQTPFIFPASRITAETTLRDILGWLRETRKEIRAHDNISLGLTRKLLPQGRLHFMYNYYHFFPQNQAMSGYPIRCIERPPYIENTVQLVVKEQEEGATLEIYYQQNCFADVGLLERIAYLSRQLLGGTDTLQSLCWVFPHEQSQQLNFWNRCKTEEQTARSVQQLFAAQVARTPHEIAVIDDHASITYAELAKRSNRIARFLHGEGVGADSRVGLCLPRSVDAIAMILGILKAGGAYVPIDASYPQERIHYMLESAQIGILFTEACQQEKLSGWHGKWIPVDDQTHPLATAIAAESADPIPDTTDAGDMLYVIFTSGSTGKPKGSIVTHRGEINLLQWYTREMAFGHDSRCLVISALGFDLTQKNLFAPLITGGRVVLSALDHYDSSAIREQITRHGITHVNTAPSAFYPLVEDHTDFQPLASLQAVVLGGEPIRLARLAPWLSSPLCNATLFNNYGPTECTDIATFYRAERGATPLPESLPIGKPNDNVQVYILNEMQQLLPVGLVGEITIGGTGVGRGYLHNEALNREKFIPNPFGSGQLYRTGDLGRYLPDGNIEFVMRRDFQVKIHGRRIEPGEIEALLRQTSGVTDALVLVENEQLLAYVTGHNLPQTETLLASLRQQLPGWMVPSAITSLATWPLTPNGKIDRKRLPQPQAPAAATAYVAPRDETEQAICDIVGRILQQPQVGIHDNFFELGGHSLAASRAIVQIREHFQVEIPLHLLFEMTTAEKLAIYIKAARWASESAHQRNLPSGQRDTGVI